MTDGQTLSWGQQRIEQLRVLSNCLGRFKMHLLPAKLGVAALILCPVLITTDLAPTIAVAQNLLPPCPSEPTVVWTDCRGVRSFPNGDQYVGEWRGGKPNGQGTYTWPNGRKYVGQFADGEFNGKGAYTWPNGGKYVGEYRDGEQNGQGTYMWPDGSKYVGEFRDGKFNGHGTLTQPDGSKYVGEFRDGEQNGQGTYTWPDGSKYVGEYQYDQRNGQGTEFSTDGRMTSGIWKDGKLVKENSGIPVEIEAGTFIVPVTINGKITLNFIIDSGASDVAVPADVVSTLIRTGR
jgi:hypothetical protein